MPELNRKKTDNSLIRLYPLSMPSPSLGDNTGDVDRLLRSIRKTTGQDDIDIPFSLTKKVTPVLRASNFECNAVLCSIRDRWKLIDVYPPGNDIHLYAAAVDLGSSTIVLRMIDIISGKTLADFSFLNPQHEVGSDILSRIHFAAEGNGAAYLQSILINSINREIRSICEKYSIRTSDIVGLAVAGNTAMTHFFLGLDPYWICREPYIPVINCPDVISPPDLGIEINAEAPVIVMPGAGSYLGGDVIAGVLASHMNNNDETCLLVDVGTNAEVVLGNREWLLACAGAAGPALEGGVAAMGMMAGEGAVDSVEIDPESREIHFSTIGGSPPAGICGSGLIDLAAQLFMSGMIDIRGKFNSDACAGRLFDIDGVQNLLVVPGTRTETGKDLYISQTDINALIRSKAAMYTILNTITAMANINLNDIDKFYIAGTFGSYINPDSAISLGMIPDLPRDRYVSLGNTSLEGAAMSLLSSERLKEIYKIRDMITYIELNVNQEFMNSFSAAKFIPHTDRSLFPSVKN